MEESPQLVYRTEIFDDHLTKEQWKTAIVIQGVFRLGWTDNSITILHEKNPHSLIIVSTYRNPESEKWLSENTKDRLVYIFIEPPDRELFSQFWEKNKAYNQNLHRLSTFVGLRYAKECHRIERCLKIRSDGIIFNQHICDFLSNLVDSTRGPLHRSQQQDGGDRNNYPSKRFVTFNRSRRSCFQASHETIGDYFVFDMWMFGQTDDLLNFYRIFKNGDDAQIGFCAETLLTECWMRNHNIAKFDDSVAELLARYFIVTDHTDVHFVWQKIENYHRFLREGISYLTEEFRRWEMQYKCFTKKDWMQWLRIVEDRDLNFTSLSKIDFVISISKNKHLHKDQLERFLGIPESKILFWDPSYTDSHIMILEHLLVSFTQPETILILEDDFKFVENVLHVKKSLSRFLSSPPENWDVLLFAYFIRARRVHDDLLSVALFSQNTSGFLIRRKAISKLLSVLRAGKEQLRRTSEHWHYASNVYWWHFMLDSQNVFYFNNPISQQSKEVVKNEDDTLKMHTQGRLVKFDCV